MLRMIGSDIIHSLPAVENYAVQQATGDVTQWDTLSAPDDDLHGVILAELTAGALAGAECHMSIYGFTDQDFADQLAILGKNPKSKFLFDKSQEAGTHERPVVQKLVASLSTDQWAIGTSSKAHAILHTKAIALLYPSGRAWTVTGSFNFSASAQNQFNVIDLIVSPSRATLFVKRIDEMFAWVQQNEPGNQP